MIADFFDFRQLAALSHAAEDALADVRSEQRKPYPAQVDAVLAIIDRVAALRWIGHQIQQLEATSVSIASAVDQQSVAGQDLSRSIDLAAHSADDVASNIVQVRETSLATGTAATQVLSSSTELEQQAARLQRQVDQFLSHVRAA